MNRENNDLLWMWILGLSDQEQNYRITKTQYEKRSRELEKEVVRLNTGREISSSRKKKGSISFGQKLDLVLLRYWNLFDCLKYSNSTLAHLKSWHEKGVEKIKELMLLVGIPLEESQQKFSYLNPQYKVHLDDKILKVSDKFGLEDICTVQFKTIVDDRHKFLSLDFCFFCNCILNSHKGFEDFANNVQ